jgi:uncharacterized integral membrane protein
MRWLLFIPLLVLLALFAMSNRQDIEMRLWPFDVTWVAPVGESVLIVAAIAFLLGAGITWTAGLSGRRRAARLERAAKALESELAQQRAKEQQARRDADMGRVAEAAVVPAPQVLAGPGRR